MWLGHSWLRLPLTADARVERADELKKFYRTINSDQRNTVVLEAVTH